MQPGLKGDRTTEPARWLSGCHPLILLLLIFIAGQICQADEKEAPGPDSRFDSGRFEASLANGALFSPFIATKNRPEINYTISELQLGYMFGRVNEQRWLAGNLEVVGGVFGSAVFVGVGNYLAGATIWARYNFVQPGWRFVPYAQAGGGV